MLASSSSHGQEDGDEDMGEGLASIPEGEEEDAGLELAGRAAGVLHADEDGSLVHLAVRANTVPRPMQVVQTCSH